MYVLVRPDWPDPVVVTDPGDLSCFEVRSTDAADEEVGAALARAGAGAAAHERHAWVKVAFLRAHAPDGAPDWDRQFAAMLDYARTRGWLAEDGSAVLGHIKRERPAIPAAGDIGAPSDRRAVAGGQRIMCGRGAPTAIAAPCRPWVTLHR